MTFKSKTFRMIFVATVLLMTFARGYFNYQNALREEASMQWQTNTDWIDNIDLTAMQPKFEFESDELKAWQPDDMQQDFENNMPN